MTRYRTLAAGALLLLAGGCDRFGDGLLGTPPPLDTTLTLMGVTYDVTHYPDISVTFTLNTNSGPAETLQLGNVAMATKEYEIDITTDVPPVINGFSLTEGPTPVVVTKMVKDPLSLGTYTISFRTKTNGWWSFLLAFDYGGLKTEVPSLLNYNDISLPILPPATPGGAGVVTAAASPGGGG